MKNIFLVFLLFFFGKISFSQQNFYTLDTRPKSKIDTVFPFDLTLRMPDSSQILSSNVLKKDRVTVLAFWLTTCFPCRIEFEEYMKNWSRWKAEADFDFVAVSTDFPKNYKKMGEMSKAFPWPTVWDSNREFSQFLPGGLNGLPQVFVFDRDGKIAYHHRKYSMGDEHELFEIIKKLQ